MIFPLQNIYHKMVDATLHLASIICDKNLDSMHATIVSCKSTTPIYYAYGKGRHTHQTYLKNNKLEFAVCIGIVLLLVASMPFDNIFELEIVTH